MICSYSRYTFLSLDRTEAPFQNIPLSQFVVLLFCLNTSLCPYPSLCYSVSKHPPVPISHSVILSQNIPPSLSVILLFCLKTSLRPYLSLCYSVSKHPPVPICHYVILSQTTSPSLSVIMLFCLKTSPRPYPSLCHSVSKHPSVPIRHYVILSQNIPRPYPSLCYSVSKHPPVPICHYVILSQNALLILIIRCLNRSVYTKKTTVNVDRLENNLYLCTRKIVIITGYKYPIYRAENQQILVYTLVISETRNNIYNTKTL